MAKLIAFGSNKLLFESTRAAINAALALRCDSVGRKVSLISLEMITSGFDPESSVELVLRSNVGFFRSIEVSPPEIVLCLCIGLHGLIDPCFRVSVGHQAIDFCSCRGSWQSYIKTYAYSQNQTARETSYENKVKELTHESNESAGLYADLVCFHPIS